MNFPCICKEGRRTTSGGDGRGWTPTENSKRQGRDLVASGRGLAGTLQAARLRISLPGSIWSPVPSLGGLKLDTVNSL